MKRKVTIISLFTVIIFSILTLSFSRVNKVNILANEVGSFTDPRDGKIYKTVKIGDQWIMAENFSYKPDHGNYWVYNNDSSNVTKFGYLYDWITANKIAPKGWHLPTETDWKTLRKSLGGKKDVYKYLGGTMESVYVQMTTGNSGFNAVLAGIRSAEGKYILLGERTDFWCSTIINQGPSFYILDAKINGKPHGLFDSKEGIAYFFDQKGNENCGKSVRLFKDND